jgi:hypothetical protein
MKYENYSVDFDRSCSDRLHHRATSPSPVRALGTVTNVSRLSSCPAGFFARMTCFQACMSCPNTAEIGFTYGTKDPHGCHERNDCPSRRGNGQERERGFGLRREIPGRRFPRSGSGLGVGMGSYRCCNFEHQDRRLPAGYVLELCLQESQ